MIDMAEFLGANETLVKEEMLEVLLFEIKLANISSRSSDIRQITYFNPIPLYYLKAGGVYPNSWSKFLENMYNNTFNVPSTEPLIISNIPYFKDLEIVLKKTKNRTLANYFAWRVALSTIRYLGEQAREIRFKFQKAVYGIKKQHPR